MAFFIKASVLLHQPRPVSDFTHMSWNGSSEGLKPDHHGIRPELAKKRTRERERERESWAVERVEEFIYGEKDGWQGRRG
jgi:hypothetical protein